MVFFNDTKIYNPWTPRIMRKGGGVYPKANMSKRQIHNDSVLAVLMPNEIVIPVRYKGKPLASKVEKYLKGQNIYLPHFKK